MEEVTSEKSDTQLVTIYTELKALKWVKQLLKAAIELYKKGNGDANTAAFSGAGTYGFRKMKSKSIRRCTTYNLPKELTVLKQEYSLSCMQ